MANLPIGTLKGRNSHALYRKLGLAGGVLESTLTGDVTLTPQHEDLLRLDPGGASRNVTLPANASSKKGTFFIIYNSADAAENLVVKDSAAATIVTVNQNEQAEVWHTGSAWVLLGVIGVARS